MREHLSEAIELHQNDIVKRGGIEAFIAVLALDSIIHRELHIVDVLHDLLDLFSRQRDIVLFGPIRHCLINQIRHFFHV